MRQARRGPTTAVLPGPQVEAYPEPMARPKIVIIGGGSHQWAPTLIADFALTPSTAEAEIVLCDLDASRLPRMVRYGELVAEHHAAGLTVTATTDRAEALAGADFVVVNISTGALASMRHDLEIPARYGVVQPVGDTVGPGGISRALRNIPVFLDIARDIERFCPDAWLLNLTNPMTQLCRAVTRETTVSTIGLCHEVTIGSFWMSVLLDAFGRDVDPVVTGVNHLPVVTELRVDGIDALSRLSELLADEAGLDRPLPDWLQDVMRGLDAEPGAFSHPGGSEVDGPWTVRRLAAQHRVKLGLLERTGALPLAGDRHLVEFFPGFLTERSGWGSAWGVALTSIAEREAEEANYVSALEARIAEARVPKRRSQEQLSLLVDSLLTGERRVLPLNIPNAGQCPDLPLDVVCEAMCVVDAAGVRGRDAARAPAALAEQLRRVSGSQELTVGAAVSGDRDLVIAALMADPLCGRVDFADLAPMADELLAATAAWLPQFRHSEGRRRPAATDHLI